MSTFLAVINGLAAIPKLIEAVKDLTEAYKKLEKQREMERIELMRIAGNHAAETKEPSDVEKAAEAAAAALHNL